MQLTLLDDVQFVEPINFLKLLINHKFSNSFHSWSIFRKCRMIIHNFLNIYRIDHGRRYFFFPDRHKFGLIIILSSKFFFKILDSCNINPSFQILIPLLILNNVVGSDMKTFKLRVVDLHEHLHDPTKMFFVFWFSYSEAF